MRFRSLVSRGRCLTAEDVDTSPGRQVSKFVLVYLPVEFTSLKTCKLSVVKGVTISQQLSSAPIQLLIKTTTLA